MPLLRMRSIRDMTSEERGKKLTELRTELLKLRAMVKAGGSIERPTRIREIRKAIAQILTVQNEERIKNETEGAEGK